jgi:hypothetical protein
MMSLPVPPVSPSPSPSLAPVRPLHHKRERELLYDDDEFEARSKRLVHDSFQSLSLSDTHSSPVPVGPTTTESASVGPFTFDQLVVDGPLTTITDNNSDSNCSNITDVLLETLKGGRRQYVRKIDYLVDEVVRKKLMTTPALSSTSSQSLWLPNFVGPSPRVDAALSLVIPLVDGHRWNTPTAAATAPHNLHYLPHPPPSSLRQGAGTDRGAYFSGDRTHTDWEIEEVGDEVDNTCWPDHGCRSMFERLRPSHDESENDNSSCDLDVVAETPGDDDTEMVCSDDWTSTGHFPPKYTSTNTMDSLDSSPMMVVDHDDDGVFSTTHEQDYHYRLNTQFPNQLPNSSTNHNNYSSHNCSTVSLSNNRHHTAASHCSPGLHVIPSFANMYPSGQDTVSLSAQPSSSDEHYMIGDEQEL